MNKLKYELGTGVLKYASNGKEYKKPDALLKRWEIAYGYTPEQEVILKNPDMPPRMDNLSLKQITPVLPEGITVVDTQFQVEWEGIVYGRFSKLSVAEQILYKVKLSAERREEHWDTTDDELVIKRGELVGILKTLTERG